MSAMRGSSVGEIIPGGSINPPISFVSAASVHMKHCCLCFWMTLTPGCLGKISAHHRKSARIGAGIRCWVCFPCGKLSSASYRQQQNVQPSGITFDAKFSRLTNSWIFSRVYECFPKSLLIYSSALVFSLTDRCIFIYRESIFRPRKSTTCSKASFAYLTLSFSW